MTKSPFVNLTIKLIDIEYAADEDAFNESMEQVCVERLYKLLSINQEDEATYIGTEVLTIILLNLLCMAHKHEDAVKIWPEYRRQLIDMYA